MNRQKTTFKTDHRYNPQAGETVSIVSINKLPAKTQDQTIRSSFREQINTVLQQWDQLQKGKTKHLPEKQVYNEFDRIMEEDLTNQLKALEQQEDDDREEEYRKLEEMLEEQLKLEESNKEQAKQDRFNLNELWYQLYGKNINHDISEQSQKFVFNGAQRVTNLFKKRWHFKKYHIQK